MLVIVQHAPLPAVQLVLELWVDADHPAGQEEQLADTGHGPGAFVAVAADVGTQRGRKQPKLMFSAQRV